MKQVGNHYTLHPEICSKIIATDTLDDIGGNSTVTWIL